MKKLSERGIFERSITEEDVFGACRQLLELNGARVHRVVERIPWGPKGRKSQPGIPDTFGWWSGRNFHRVLTSQQKDLIYPCTFFIEFKKPGGDKRPAQERWIAEARADGVIAFFADSVEAMVAGFAEYGIKIKGV